MPIGQEGVNKRSYNTNTLIPPLSGFYRFQCIDMFFINKETTLKEILVAAFFCFKRAFSLVSEYRTHVTLYNNDCAFLA